jgi:GntR family transcriptional regulator / MocR family aminotransferase
VGWLPLGVDDARVAEEAARAGIHTIPVSAFAVRPLQRGGLLLGYAAFTPDLIKKGLRDLESVVRICLRAPYGGCRMRTATAI